MGAKVFVIGLDGATWDIIDPLSARAELPVITSLAKDGTRAVLRSTLIPTSPAAWTSFATGMTPNKHGIYDFARRRKDSYDTVPFNSRDRRSEALWNILGREGRKVCVLNVPGTYPVERVNGIMVSGFPTPEELGDFTYPSDLLDELRREIGPEFRFQPRVSTHNEAPFLREMHDVTDHVFRATNHVMNHHPWDLLITVFVGPDALGHAFWKYMDSGHPHHEDRAPPEYKSAVFDIYKKIDSYISILIENVDSDTKIVLMSDHGFGPLHYGVSINTWLLSEGFLSLKDTMGTRTRYWLFRRGVNYSNLFKMARALRLAQHASKAAYSGNTPLVNLINKIFLTDKDIDWSRTEAYSMGNVGQLYINLKGREPQGTVEPQGRYNEVVGRIIKRLQAFRDPRSNEPVFDAVHWKMETYPDAVIEDDTPDIIFYDSEMKYNINRFFTFGSKHLITDHPVWVGTHKHDGIFLAYDNEDIRKGATIGTTSICDIAPTILHIMGVPVPGDMDGRVLTEIFDRDSGLGRGDIRYQDAEEKRIKERVGILRNRGRI